MRAFLYYIPKGEKTGVTVVGDYFMSGSSEETVREVVSSLAKIAFEEDNSNLRQQK